MESLKETECDGTGHCLKKGNKKNEYYQDKDITCEYNCNPIKCPNYLVCKTMEPLYSIQQHELCVDCVIMFGEWQGGKGKLTFFDTTKCPICLEIKLCVSHSNCNHYSCIECFNLWLYKKEPRKSVCPLCKIRDGLYV